MQKKTDFTNAVLLAFKREILKKLVFSRPVSKDNSAIKISGRLCAHRGKRILALEYSLSGNTVSQKNIQESDVESTVLTLLEEYMQANLITTLSDVEWKISKSGKVALLGADSFFRKLSTDKPSFESAIESLDKKKNYILEGTEDFLFSLGISDKNGRVHDKKQGKFRQINRFLEHIEALYPTFPKDKTLYIFDLCCGKSYLSFAVYYYLTVIKSRKVELLGIDLKKDVINWCDALAKELNYSGMHFICDDITNTPKDVSPDMVISLHACDIATDIVLNAAVALKAPIILSTPCCHKHMNGKITNPDLKFVTDYPHLSGKLCEAFTDALRVSLLKKHGYNVSAIELTDPENTPKNTLIRAILDSSVTDGELKNRETEYKNILAFLFGTTLTSYPDFK